MWIIKYLFGGLKFLSLYEEGPFYKTSRVFVFGAPIFTSIVFFSAIYFGVLKINLQRSEEFERNVFQILVFFVPFALGSLTLAASSNNKGLDQELKGTPVYSSRGSDSEEITLRVYIVSLFSYLCYIGFIAICFIALSGIVDLGDFITIQASIPGFELIIIRLYFWIFFLFHFLFTSIYGLYFLASKLTPG